MANNKPQTAPARKKLSSGQKIDLTTGILAGVGAPLAYVGLKRARAYQAKAPQRFAVDLWKAFREYRTIPGVDPGKFNRQAQAKYSQYVAKMRSNLKRDQAISFEDFSNLYTHRARVRNPVGRAAARKIDELLIKGGYIDPSLRGNMKSLHREQLIKYVRGFDPEKKRYSTTKDDVGRTRVILQGIEPKTRRQGIYEITGQVKDPITKEHKLQVLRGDLRKEAYLAQNARLDPVFAQAENQVEKIMAGYARKGVKNVDGIPVSRVTVMRKVLNDMGLGDIENIDEILKLREPMVGRGKFLRSLGSGQGLGGFVSKQPTKWYDRFDPRVMKSSYREAGFKKQISKYPQAIQDDLLRDYREIVRLLPSYRNKNVKVGDSTKAQAAILSEKLTKKLEALEKQANP